MQKNSQKQGLAFWRALAHEHSRYTTLRRSRLCATKEIKHGPRSEAATDGHRLHAGATGLAHLNAGARTAANDQR